MHRRNFILTAAIAAIAPQLARAHHGWSGFDADTPVYLRGRIKAVKWENPHAMLTIEIADGLQVPADLAGRALPAQASPVDGADILRRTKAPPAGEREWTLELAPLFRVNQWKIAEPAVGDEVEAIGYILRMEDAPAFMRVEYLFVGDKTYGLRSGPA
ncbi:DUF6152 family protein [Pseudazoarcus pumilus]|uniref:Uncharacterized protein n=1 Tax=Pseudazoarcus pumilus TaxID=2067960 RepID=A0A2I6SA97_9RHOO|nr:DUF6152 family protein [Pseudazoarcus pumilus]AUN96165.1 hypothetical protein C0099_15190 [Pseudazoarcus pumilus]